MYPPQLNEQLSAIKAPKKVNTQDENEERWKNNKDQEAKRHFEEQMQLSEKKEAQKQVEGKLRRGGALRHQHEQELKRFERQTGLKKQESYSHDKLTKNNEEKSIRQNNQQSYETKENIKNTTNKNQKSQQNVKNERDSMELSTKKLKHDSQSKEISTKQKIASKNAENKEINRQLADKDQKELQKNTLQSTIKENIAKNKQTATDLRGKILAKDAQIKNTEKLSAKDKENTLKQQTSLQRSNNNYKEGLDKKLQSNKYFKNDMIKNKQQDATIIKQNIDTKTKNYASKQAKSTKDSEKHLQQEEFITENNSTTLAKNKLHHEVKNKATTQKQSILNETVQQGKQQETKRSNDLKEGIQRDNFTQEFSTHEKSHANTTARQIFNQQQTNKLKQQQLNAAQAFKASEKTVTEVHKQKKEDDKIIENKKIIIEMKPIPLPPNIHNTIISKALTNPATRVEMINHIAELVRQTKHLDIKGAFNINLPGKFWEGTKMIVTIAEGKLSIDIDANFNNVDLLKNNQQLLKNSLQKMDNDLNIAINIKEL